MKSLDHYIALPYTAIVKKDEEGDFVARVDELPGCVADGSSPAEALSRLEEAKALWIEDALDANHPIPEPQPEEFLPSGKWVQRVPRTLHKKLVDLARQDGVSLNQFVLSALAETAGFRRSPQIQRPISTGRNNLARVLIEHWSEVNMEWAIQHNAARPISIGNPLYFAPAMEWCVNRIPDQISDKYKPEVIEGGPKEATHRRRA